MNTIVRALTRNASVRSAAIGAAAMGTALFAPVSAAAQTLQVRERPLIFANVQMNAGTGSGLHAGIAGIFGGRHEVGLGYEAVFIPATQFPDDYECPRCKHGFGNNWISGLAATYGYGVYPGKGQRFLRFTFRGGVLLGAQSVAGNFTPVANPAPRESNYTYDDAPRFGAALVIRPTIDLAVNRNFGLALGSFGVVNEDLSAFGLVFGIRFGRVAADGLHYRLQARNRARAEMLRQRAH